MRIAPSLVGLALSACGGAIPVQLVSGTVTPGFPERPTQVRALREGAVVASVPVDASGEFILAVPAAKVRIELSGNSGHLAFLAAAGGSGPADIDLCRPGDVLALHDLSFCPPQAACIDATTALAQCQAQPANASCVSCGVACTDELAAADACRFRGGIDCTEPFNKLTDCETTSSCTFLGCPCDELAAAATGACATACSRSSEPLALATTAPPAAVGCGP